ncbi:hypothetical protein F5887DRAFT_1174975 [Amanita rubescens]|nr:hypothetical protein F5887DRAFT_1174975 [Amanita rubescens]
MPLLSLSLAWRSTFWSLYTVRVWKLSSDRKRIWAPILIVNLTLVYASSITAVVKLYRATSFSQIHQFRWEIFLGFSMMTLSDFMLAAAIYHLLSSLPTSSVQTDSTIWTIISYSVISGMLTSICSLASVITLALMSHTLVFQAIEFLLPKLYINSYLAMLNSRRSTREHSISNSSSVALFRSRNIGSRNTNSFTSLRFPNSVVEPEIPSLGPSGAIKIKMKVSRSDDRDQNVTTT